MNTSELIATSNSEEPGRVMDGLQEPGTGRVNQSQILASKVSSKVFLGAHAPPEIAPVSESVSLSVSHTFFNSGMK